MSEYWIPRGIPFCDALFLCGRRTSGSLLDRYVTLNGFRSATCSYFGSWSDATGSLHAQIRLAAKTWSHTCWHSIVGNVSRLLRNVPTWFNKSVSPSSQTCARSWPSVLVQNYVFSLCSTQNAPALERESRQKLCLYVVRFLLVHTARTMYLKSYGTREKVTFKWDKTQHSSDKHCTQLRLAQLWTVLSSDRNGKKLYHEPRLIFQ